MTMRHVQRTQQTCRNGLARLDVIVMLLVFALLCAVIGPALSRPRITSRKMTCLNNLRCVGVAVLNFTSSSPENELPSLSTDIEIINIKDQHGKLAAPWSMQLLPMLDATAVLNNIKKNALIDSGNTASDTMRISDTEKIWLENFTCPENLNSHRKPGGLSYVVNAGFFPRDLYHGDPEGLHGVGVLSWDGNNVAGEELDIRVSAATGVFWRAHKSFRFTMDDVTTGDGTSSTLMLTENLQAGKWYETDTAKIGFGLPVVATNGQVSFGKDAFFESVARPLNTNFEGGNLATAKPRDWPINADPKAQQGTRPRPSSNHQGGVNAMFCDGSCRFLSDGIDPQVYIKLLTSNGVSYGEFVFFGRTEY